jgi:murein DD-endopeptidase MepM/ murein hydrolase activator NlpD
MFQKPFNGNFRMTFGFGEKYGNIFGLLGKRHQGIDYALPCGTSIYSPSQGTVTSVNYSNYGFGNHVYIQYGTITVLFAHLQTIYVTKGQIVNTGQVVALSNNTGASTGCHLHIGVIDSTDQSAKVGQWSNPTRYFNFDSAPVTPTTPATQTYKVVPGDSLWKIAKKYYGDGTKWPTIYNANKTIIANPSLIYPGQILTIPK